MNLIRIPVGLSMYKLLFLIAVLAFTVADSSAQQEALYTQYQFNKLAINPAYAGSRSGFSMTGVYRDQWVGEIEGAPRTASFVMHAPVGNRVGLGLQLVNDRLGAVDETGAWGNFAFRFPAGTGEFALGISAGVSYYRTDLNGVFIVDANDPVFSSNQALWLPNVGFGAYYHTDNFYVGVATPRLIDNSLIETSGASSGAQSASQTMHFNAMTGFVFDLGETVKLRPSALIRYQQNNAFTAEANLSALLVDRIWVGAGYRSGGSADFNLEYQISSVLRLGYSYDLVLNALSPVTGGSHEVLMGIDLGSKSVPVANPRNFVPQYF
jgi:type IX secretion system PorP/SprF family membrane protein